MKRDCRELEWLHVEGIMDFPECFVVVLGEKLTGHEIVM
jgi:hypothetical protein